MATLKLVLVQCIILGLYGSCTWAVGKQSNAVHYSLVGCTPGDNLIKFQLGIPTETKVDFIRWELLLDKSDQSSFTLTISYGESQPNTLGFKEGGQKKSYAGNFSSTQNKGNEMYRLESSHFQQAILLVKLNDNLFHLLTPQKQLMIGNGGWSYTLNNKNPSSSPVLPVLSQAMNDTTTQWVYEGRTPCQEFALEHQLKVSQACFKLKWKLTFDRDPVSHTPTTYRIRKIVDNQPKDITGNWTIIKGTKSDPNATIYQLDPDKPEQTISLLVADDNILLFLHKDNSLFVGNENFSFTLNKQSVTKK